MTLFLECRIMSASWMALQALLLSLFRQLSWTVASSSCRSRYSYPSCVVWLIISTRSTVQTEPTTQLLCLEVGNRFSAFTDWRTVVTLTIVPWDLEKFKMRSKLDLHQRVLININCPCKLSTGLGAHKPYLSLQCCSLSFEGVSKVPACRLEKCWSAYYRGRGEICFHCQWALQLHLQGNLTFQKHQSVLMNLL